MNEQKHIVIFSHGFGVRKDDLGLLSNIADSLKDCTSILFDYFDIDEEKETLTVRPFSEQVKKLTDVYNETRLKYPNAIIDIIGHSQGTIIPSLAKLKGIRKTILLAPVFDLSIERTLKRYANKPDTIIDLEGMSKLYKLDGYDRFIPKEYWVERKIVKPFDIYNEYSLNSELIIINANQDAILGIPDLSELNENIQVISLDGGHNFNDKDRDGLLKTIKGIIEK